MKRYTYFKFMASDHFPSRCSMAAVITALISSLLICFRLSDSEGRFFFILLSASFIFAMAAVFIFMSRILFQSGQSINSNLLMPIFMLFISIWILRFNISFHTGIFSVNSDEPSIDSTLGLNAFEHFWNSMVHTLQSFSMDEDYTEFVFHGKQYINTLSVSQNFKNFALFFYGTYSVVLNALAPIAGGAILFDILTNIFPQFRLGAHLFFHPFTINHVFSELNDRSLALAESIRSKRPDQYIIFTDVYIDEEQEIPSELLIRAKKINALCLKSDLSILKRLSHGPVCYYLMDDSEASNIQSFAALSEYDETQPDKVSFVKTWLDRKSSVKIFIFSDLPVVEEMTIAFNQTISKLSSINNQTIEKQPAEAQPSKEATVDGQSPEKRKTLPLFVKWIIHHFVPAYDKTLDIYAKPVNISQALCYDLIQQYPLYRNIMDETPSTGKQVSSVSILLLGDSPLIRQFIRTVYWCGQMLNPYRLSEIAGSKEADIDKLPEQCRIYPVFHIVTPNADDIRNFIASEMPQVFKEILVEEDPSSPSPDFPYARFRFYSSELNNQAVNDIIRNVSIIDYCLIDTGNDLDNLSLSNAAKQIFDVNYLSVQHPCDILCMIENSELNRINVLSGSVANNAVNKIRTHYVGSISMQYDIDSIEMTQLEEAGYWISSTHETGKKKREECFTAEFYKDLYDFRSSVASALHYPYKLFSSGCFHVQSAEYPVNSYRLNEKQHSIEFLKNLLDPNILDDKYNPVSYSDFCMKKFHYLVWLEKIRWNAYEKSIGFYSPTFNEVKSFFTMYNQNQANSVTLWKSALKLHTKPSYSSHTLPLHCCLIDLPYPTGVGLNKLHSYISDTSSEPYYMKIRSSIKNDFLNQPADSISLEDFLQKELDVLQKQYSFLSDFQLDILDIFSMLSDESGETEQDFLDYKNYDLEQLIVIAARLIYCDDNKSIAILKDNLQKLIDSKQCYLQHQLEKILSTIAKMKL